MGGVVATILGWMALGLAFVSLPSRFPFWERVRALSVWSLCCPILFLVRDPLLILVVALPVVVLLTPSSPPTRVGFFMAIVPCLPFYLAAPLPFPGLTQLFTLTPYKVIVLAVLLPIIFSSRMDVRRRSPLSVAELLFAAYIAYTCTVVLSATNSTNTLRYLVDQTLVLVLPYFIIRYSIRSVDDFDVCARGFLVASTVLAAIAIVSAAKGWDFYRDLFPPSIFAIPDTRSGFARIEATINTHSLGYHLAAALVLLQYMKSRIAISSVQTWTLRALFTAGLFLTNSRGAMLGLLIAGGVYLLLSIHSATVRKILALACLAALGAAAYWTIAQDTSNIDPYGTVAYRQELLATSVRVVLDNPVFGDVDYLTSGKFDHLVQGLGIIDITNLYLQLALPYGLLGMLLFLGVIVSPLFALAHRRRKTRKRGYQVLVSLVPLVVLTVVPARKHNEKPTGPSAGAEDRRRAYNVVASVILGWLALAATTSDMGATVHIGLAFAALGRALRCMETGPAYRLPAIHADVPARELNAQPRNA